MQTKPWIESDRVILRRWRAEDREPFAGLNADPRVMEFFPSTLTREQSDGMIEIIEGRIEKLGIGFLAAELKETSQFIGFVGLSVPRDPFPFSPCVEIGWRLAYPFWGKGLATEAARASLDYGFRTRGLQEIVSFTTQHNWKSRHVMEKLGMSYEIGADFDHPKLNEGHPLRRHVLYRLRRELWQTQTPT